MAESTKAVARTYVGEDVTNQLEILASVQAYPVEKGYTFRLRSSLALTQIKRVAPKVVAYSTYPYYINTREIVIIIIIIFQIFIFDTKCRGTLR